MEKFEDVINEGILKYLNERGLDRLNCNNIQLGCALTEFYIRDIAQFTYGIYEGDIQDGLLCDGKNDFNIDFAYRNDKSIIIAQTKFKGSKNAINSDELSGFYGIHDTINRKDFFDKYANRAVKDAIGEITDEVSITYVLVTNDKPSERINEQFEELKQLNQSSKTDVIYEFKYFSELKKDYKQVVSETEAIADNIVINIETINDSFTSEKTLAYLDLTPLLSSENRYQSLLCTVKGTTLKKLWEEHKAKLFNYNIRGYLGSNPINKKMEETLMHEPDKFYFYNNGLSAICTDIEPIYFQERLHQLRCSNFQIINGAQTTTTIAKFKDANKLSQVRILLKITKAEDYKKEKGLNKKIITYNNSQTIIKAADFRSNDSIQIFLENKLKDFKYKGSTPYKEVKYIRKRLKVESRKDVLNVTLETLARVLYVFDNDPILIFKGTKYLFDIDEATGKYWIVFGDEGDEVEFYDEKRLNKTIGLYFLWTKLEDLLKIEAKTLTSAGEVNTVKYQSLLAKWHFLWAYGYLLNHFYKEDLNTVFRRLASGKTFEKEISFIERWFKKVHKTISLCIQRQYQSKKEGDTTSFNFKNWLRNADAFEELKQELSWLEKEEVELNDH